MTVAAGVHGRPKCDSAVIEPQHHACDRARIPKAGAPSPWSPSRQGLARWILPVPVPPTSTPSGQVGGRDQTANAAAHDDDAMHLTSLSGSGHRCHFSAVIEASARCHARCELTVLPPDEAEIGQVIRRPALEAGLRFEVDPRGIGLDEHIRQVAAAEKGTLPLLSFLLDQLWRQCAEGADLCGV